MPVKPGCLNLMAPFGGDKNGGQDSARLSFDYYAPGCRKVFKVYSHYETLIKAEVERVIGKEAETGFSKTKTASRLPFRGARVLECRVNVGTIPPIRSAFVLKQGVVTVVFLSTDIQKSVFTKELDLFLRS